MTTPSLSGLTMREESAREGLERAAKAIADELCFDWDTLTEQPVDGYTLCRLDFRRAASAALGVGELPL